MNLDRVPPELGPAELDLAVALSVPVLANWPEEESYLPAAQPEAIAQVLIGTVHEDLVDARIAYLFRETMSKGADRVQLGHASKVGGKWRVLAELDFVIELNWTMWRQLTAAQRIALIDHELCHCGLDLEKDQWILVHHDVEEFGDIVRRWGLWKQDLELFAKQLDLFRQENLEVAT